MISESPAEGETAKFLAKQEIVWKGFLNMLNVAKFVTKGYLVSGSAESLKMVKVLHSNFSQVTTFTHRAVYRSDLSVSLDLLCVVLRRIYLIPYRSGDESCLKQFGTMLQN